MNIKPTECLLYADQCRQMAEQTNSLATKERWLVLSSNWLRLAGEHPEDKSDHHKAALKIVP